MSNGIILVISLVSSRNEAAITTGVETTTDHEIRTLRNDSTIKVWPTRLKMQDENRVRSHTEDNGVFDIVGRWSQVVGREDGSGEGDKIDLIRRGGDYESESRVMMNHR